MGEVKDLKREVKAKVEEVKIPIEQVPANIKMPEQLTEEELKLEVNRLRSILKQADARMHEMANTLSLKRIEFLFDILKDKGFDSEVEDKVRKTICEELGIFFNNEEQSETTE